MNTLNRHGEHFFRQNIYFLNKDFFFCFVIEDIIFGTQKLIVSLVGFTTKLSIKMR